MLDGMVTWYFRDLFYNVKVVLGGLSYPAYWDQVFDSGITGTLDRSIGTEISHGHGESTDGFFRCAVWSDKVLLVQYGSLQQKCHGVGDVSGVVGPARHYGDCSYVARTGEAVRT